RDWSSDVCSSDLQYREPLPRGGVHGRERADRLGADPVRPDLRGEPHRPVDHQPPRRILRSQLMNTIAPPLPVRRHRKLPRWAPYAILAASAVVSVGILALLTGGVPVPGLLALTAVLYTVSVTVTSHVVEGPRWAKDRLATALVTGAFLVALIRSEEHTSELQSRFDLVCRLLLEKKKKFKENYHMHMITENATLD